MNKKQAGIIVTLLALIVCAGILAAKVNGPLEVTGDGFTNENGILTFQEDKDEKAAADYFATERDTKDQQAASALANYKIIMDNDDLDKEARNEASKKYTELTNASTFEQKIEQQLQVKGFEDVICFLENANTKARIVIKTTEKDLTAQQGKTIKDVVYSIAQISNVEVELKQ